MERVKRKESLFVESVVEGLWELLEDKSFEKISVSELVERAGIGRVSFYRNLSNKEEELKRSFNMELQAWLSEPCRIGRMVIYYQLYANFLTFGMSNRIKFAC